MGVIYADHAATTKLDINAFEAMKPFLINEYGNASQPYSFSRAPKLAMKKARKIIAKCINAEPEEIFFTSGGSESDNWAIKGVAGNYNDKKNIITSEIEHHAILHTCNSVEKMGYKIKYLPVDSNGIVNVSTLENVITEDTKLISIMYANNEIGSVQQIKELCEVAHEYGAIFHTDAVQATGHIKIDVKDLGVDMLSASAHKFNGPKGIGFLYVKKGIDLLPLIDGGAQENGYRAGTENVASIVGMAVALENNCKNIMANEKYLKRLENVFLSELDSYNIDYIRNGSDNHIPGNMSISIKNAEGEMLLHRLDLMGICVSTGSACNSKETEISHVLKAIKLPIEYAKGTIRISLGYENTEEEVKRIAYSIKKILSI